MKFLIYGGVVVFIIPFQAVVIHRFAIGGVVPDVILVAVCLAGLWRGVSEAAVLGLVLGFMQDLLSGAMGWVNLMTKPLIGLSASVFRRAPIALTPWTIPVLLMGVSLVSGLLVVLLLQARSPEMDVLQAMFSTVVPQAVYDGVLGTIVLFGTSRLVPVLNRGYGIHGEPE